MSGGPASAAERVTEPAGAPARSPRPTRAGSGTTRPALAATPERIPGAAAGAAGAAAAAGACTTGRLPGCGLLRPVRAGSLPERIPETATASRTGRVAGGTRSRPVRPARTRERIPRRRPRPASATTSFRPGTHPSARQPAQQAPTLTAATGSARAATPGTAGMGRAASAQPGQHPPAPRSRPPHTGTAPARLTPPHQHDNDHRRSGDPVHHQHPGGAQHTEPGHLTGKHCQPGNRHHRPRHEPDRLTGRTRARRLRRLLNRGGGGSDLRRRCGGCGDRGGYGLLTHNNLPSLAVTSGPVQSRGGPSLCGWSVQRGGCSSRVDLDLDWTNTASPRTPRGPHT